jgi:PKHD-type hydroxylase
VKHINPKVWEIPQLHVPLEDIVIWGKGFDDTEIQDIIALGELADFQKGSVGGKKLNNPTVDLDIRNTDITWLEPSQQSEWLYERVKQIVAKVNYDKFQFDLYNIQALQYGKYKKDGHYNWHIDCGQNLNVHRKLSFIVGLTEPDEYEGGELLFNVSGNAENSHTLKIKKGDLLAFPSYIPHKVTPVTSGERLTLVTWATGPRFR